MPLYLVHVRTIHRIQYLFPKYKHVNMLYSSLYVIVSMYYYTKLNVDFNIQRYKIINYVVLPYSKSFNSFATPLQSFVDSLSSLVLFLRNLT